MGKRCFRLRQHRNQALTILILLGLVIVSCNLPTNTGSDQNLTQSPTADLNVVGESPVTRAEFILQLAPYVFGESYQPPVASGAVFSDLNGHWAEDLIEAFATAGYIAGYADGTFGPDNPVERAEAAVMLLRAKYGPTYTPPEPTGGVFADIEGHWAQAWVEALAADGIVESNPEMNFRPSDKITQREVIVWILEVFGVS